MTDEDRIEQIREALATAIIAFAFEPNDKATWDAATVALGNTLAGFPFIVDHVVVCSEHNNNPDTHDMTADVAFKLTDHVEFMYMPVTIGLAEITTE